MRVFQTLGRFGLILCVIGSSMANGQTTFGQTDTLPGLGVWRSPAGRLSLMLPLSGSRQAVPLDQGNIFTARQTVAERNRLIKSIRVGATRAQFMRLFERAGGCYALHDPGEGVYSFREAPNIKVRVNFGNKDDTAPKSSDRITKMSAPYWEQVAYD